MTISRELDEMARFVTSIVMIALNVCATLASANPIGMVESWDLYAAVQNAFGDFNQVIDRTVIVQTPFVTTQNTQIGSSTAETYLNVTIDDHNLVMVVQPEHYCEKTATVWPRCLSSGVIFLTPSVDVQLDVTGSYTYHLGGDPIAFYANVRTSDSTAGVSLINIDYSIDSFLDPSDGTLPFNASTLLTAGHRYRVFYRFASDIPGVLPPIGAVVSGNGGILIEAHPVPEPAALGALAFAALAFVRKRTKSQPQRPQAVLVVIVILLSHSQTIASPLPIDGLLYTAVSSNTADTQSNTILGPPSLPFSATHTATMGLSTAQASYAFQLGANYVDYLITVQHHCVQEINNHTFCRSDGSIDFIPRNDVVVTIDGHYNYNMTTDPMDASVGAKVFRIGSPTTVLFFTGSTVATGFGPASGTIPLAASGLLTGGSRYQLFYSSRISFFGGAPTTATADGIIHFLVTEVPEPVTVGPLVFAALLICRPKKWSSMSPRAL